MKLRIALFSGVAFALVGCGTVDDEMDPDDLGEENIAETSAALETPLPFAQNRTYHILHTDAEGVTTVVGYVFASPSTIPGVVQEQRWILYGGFALPEGIVDFVLPPTTMRYTSLLAWRRAIPSLWTGNATYIKAVTRPLESGGLEVCSEPLELPRPVMPPPSGGATPDQFVDEIAWSDGPLGPLAIAFGGPFANIESTEAALTNTEYWGIDGNYEPSLTEGMKLRFIVTPADPDATDALCVPHGFKQFTTNCQYFIGARPPEAIYVLTDPVEIPKPPGLAEF